MTSTTFYLSLGLLATSVAAQPTPPSPTPPPQDVRPSVILDSFLTNPSPELLRRVSEFYGELGAFDARVNLDLENATVGEALKSILDPAKYEYTVDEDVSQDVRVTVRAQNVKLSTALNLITEAAGVRWAMEPSLVRVLGRGVPRPGAPSAGPQGAKQRIRVGKMLGGGIEAALNMLGDRILLEARGAAPYVFTRQEERSTFSCPHCKGQSTLLRVKQQPKCTKCGRLFESNWQFCPADGTKRPAAPSDWRFCPLCGKQVQGEK